MHLGCPERRRNIFCTAQAERCHCVSLSGESESAIVSPPPPPSTGTALTACVGGTTGGFSRRDETAGGSVSPLPWISTLQGRSGGGGGSWVPEPLPPKMYLRHFLFVFCTCLFFLSPFLVCLIFLTHKSPNSEQGKPETLISAIGGSTPHNQSFS